MAKIERKAQYCADRRNGEATFTLDQIRDVCALLKVKQYPDSRFSDDECCLWSELRREFHLYDF